MVLPAVPELVPHGGAGGPQGTAQKLLGGGQPVSLYHAAGNELHAPVGGLVQAASGVLVVVPAEPGVIGAAGVGCKIIQILVAGLFQVAGVGLGLVDQLLGCVSHGHSFLSGSYQKYLCAVGADLAFYRLHFKLRWDIIFLQLMSTGCALFI